MNQSILFNDDLTFNEQSCAWVFTGQLAGALIFIAISEKYYSRNIDANNELKFDCEDRVETWLESYEPDENNQIIID